MNEYLEAARSHRMWFGSYNRAGELKKIQVWCFLKNGNLEFLTPGDSYKARRVGRNPAVICHLGSENGPAIHGSAELISDPAELWRGYRAYWKTHPWMMLLLAWTVRSHIRSGRQVMIRVRPAEPNPLAGVTDPLLEIPQMR